MAAETSSRVISAAAMRTVDTLRALGDALVVTETDGTVILWTAEAESLLGWRADEAVGQSLMTFLDPSPADVAAPRRQSLLGTLSWQGPASVTRSDRSKITVHLSLAQIASDDPADGPTVTVVRVRPFIERGQHARSAELDQSALQQALDNLAALVMITAGATADASSIRIVYVNEAFERTMGFARHEVLGRSPVMLRGVETDAGAALRIDVAVRDRERIREELLHYTRDGEPLWLDLDVIPVESAGGSFMQWIAVERDTAPHQGQEVALRAREERLRLALNAVWDGLWDWHVPTGYCYYAPRWYSMLGFTEHALPPHIDTFLDLLHPQDLPRCEQALRDHFDGHADTYALEVRLRTSSNTWRWILTRGTVVERDSHDRPVRMVGTHTDISERKQTELALRTSEARFRTLTMASPLGIFLTDASGACTFVTPRMLDLWGAPIDALLGSGFRDSAQMEDRDLVRTEWMRAVTSGSDLMLEYRIERPDGELRWVCERTAAHRDGATIMGFVGTVEDITEARRTADERRRLEVQLQHAQKLESLGVLAGGIAHDFNNLLVGILGNVSVALDDVTPGSPIEELLGDVEASARRAAELTTQLLAYAGKGRFNVQPIDLSAVVRSTASLLQSSVSKRATFTMTLGADLPTISADAAQVQQIVMSLVTNASDALEERPGDIVLRTDVMDADPRYLAECFGAGSSEPGRFVYVEVRDSGVGMSAATVARVFDPFFTTKFTGSGLGLAATLGIAKGHRGALHLESAEGIGTVIRVLFPAIDAQAPVQFVARTVPTEQRVGTILVVDDEASVRLVARRMLERAGYHVLIAVDGHDGLRMFTEHADEISAIVLDVTMPKLSGTDVLAELRRRGSAVPVVLASGYTAESLAAPLAGSLPPVFVQKPFGTAQLLTGIDAAIARSRGMLP